jgi:hypothetical protein
MRKAIGIDHRFHFISNGLTYSAQAAPHRCRDFPDRRQRPFQSLLALGDYLLGDLNQLFCAVLPEPASYVRLHWICAPPSKRQTGSLYFFPLMSQSAISMALTAELHIPVCPRGLKVCRAAAKRVRFPMDSCLAGTARVRD